MLDTCCIDKRSSAELSEAINSMYSWYENSLVCLVILEDVTFTSQDLIWRHNTEYLERKIRGSVWFTRAWTLQELIAPRNVEFYDSAGKSFGSKLWMRQVLQTITGIDENVLKKTRPLEKCLVAEKMSWASARVSTRPEDIAYSLMGIFDVNMPLLYGERRNAFVRLQDEIVRRTNDPTILFWGLDSTANTLFASSPEDFHALHGMKIGPPQIDTFNLTNTGIDIEADLVEWNQTTYGLHIGLLKWTFDGIDLTTAPGEYMLLLRQNRSRGTMYRTGLVRRPWRKPGDPTLWTENKSFTLSRANREQELAEIHKSSAGFLGFQVPTHTVVSIKYVKTSDLQSSSRWEHENNILSTGGACVNCKLFGSKRDGVIRVVYTTFGKQQVHVDLGFDFNCNPCAFLHHKHDDRCIWDVRDLSSEPKRPSTGEGTGQRRMVSMTDARTGHVGFFLRCTNDEETSAAIPEALSPGPQKLWARLVPPGHRRGAHADLWTFHIQDVAQWAFWPGNTTCPERTENKESREANVTWVRAL